MMMTQMRLNFDSQQVRRDIGDPYEMHRTMQRLVDGHDARPLWRLDYDSAGNSATVLLQTKETPNPRAFEALDEDYLLSFESRPNQLLENIDAGDALHFRVWANPTVTREGKRHGLVRYEEQIAWIERTFQRHGTSVPGVRAGAIRRVVAGRRRASRPIVVMGVMFDGRLTVHDANAFRAAVIQGIGPAKSLGFGLVTLAR